MSTPIKISRDTLRAKWGKLRTAKTPRAMLMEESHLKMMVVLQELFYEPRISNQEIADRLGELRNSVASVVERAEALGYIERQLERKHGSRRVVVLTKEGRGALAEVVAKLAAKLGGTKP